MGPTSSTPSSLPESVEIFLRLCELSHAADAFRAAQVQAEDLVILQEVPNSKRTRFRSDLIPNAKDRSWFFECLPYFRAEMVADENGVVRDIPPFRSFSAKNDHGACGRESLTISKDGQHLCFTEVESGGSEDGAFEKKEIRRAIRSNDEPFKYLVTSFEWSDEAWGDCLGELRRSEPSGKKTYHPGSGPILDIEMQLQETGARDGTFARVVKVAGRSFVETKGRGG